MMKQVGISFLALGLAGLALAAEVDDSILSYLFAFMSLATVGAILAEHIKE